MKLNYKKIVSIFSITILIITIVLIGASYAWYAANNKTKIEIESLGEEKMQITFNEDNIISLNNAIPISDELASSEASINTFNISLGQMDFNTTFSIKITDIVIDTELKISNFKYDLLKDNVSVATGSFENIANDTEKTIYTQNMTNETLASTNTWQLRVWLSDDESNQNAIMNKGFSGKVQASIYIGG